MKRDHPRVCGEHSIAHVPWHVAQGSSPRMRGTRPFAFSRQSRVGIIPAYAGNTTGENTFIRPTRDHPRVCGEHLPPARCPHAQTGSSPRMRGTRTPASRESVQNGIIPAYAGNTHVEERTYSSCRDHPRVCGEHADLREHDHIGRGSSPRMRGTPTASGVGVPLIGIIPAYAGNTGDNMTNVPQL